MTCANFVVNGAPPTRFSGVSLSQSLPTMISSPLLSRPLHHWLLAKLLEFPSCASGRSSPCSLSCARSPLHFFHFKPTNSDKHTAPPLAARHVDCNSRPSASAREHGYYQQPACCAVAAACGRGQQPLPRISLVRDLQRCRPCTRRPRIACLAAADGGVQLYDKVQSPSTGRSRAQPQEPGAQVLPGACRHRPFALAIAAYR
jgi:hypothetical protein